MTKRAAVYARYSSEEQTGGESIEYQLEQCKDHITKKGWSLGEVFVDRAKSGTSTYRREAFNRMVALAKAKDRPFDVVVAWSTSRFGRNMDECAVNKAFLRKHGVEVQFVSQPLPEGHVGKLIEKIFEWTDELQSIQIGEYAFQGQKQVTQKGFHGGGKAPYGYKRVRVSDPEGKTDKDGKVVEYVTYEVVEDQAEVVRRVFRMYSEGSSYKKVAHTFNTEGITSPGGGTWDVSSVRSMLLNENYLGHRVWNQTRRNKKLQRGAKVPKPREEWVIVKGAHPAVVDQELWDAVQERRGRMSRHINKGKSWYNTGHAPYLLSGLLRCEVCGGNYVISGAKKLGGARYYRCAQHANRGNSVCTNRRNVRLDRLESSALKAVSGDLLRVDVIEDIIDVYRDLAEEVHQDVDTVELDKALRQIEKEITNLTASLKAVGPVDELVKETKACQARKVDLEVKKQERLAFVPVVVGDIDMEEVREGLKDLQQTLQFATPKEKKSLMRENVSEIRIPERGKPLLVSNPEGLLTSVSSLFHLVTPRGIEEVANSPGVHYALIDQEFLLWSSPTVEG